MFSSRFPRSFAPNRLARALERKRRRGAPLLDLTESNPTRAGLSPAGAELHEALAVAGADRYEPHPRGLASARDALAAYHAERGAGVRPDRITLTASTSEAYAHLFRLLGDPGDEFLVPRPSYPLFEPLAALESVRLVAYPLHYDGRWTLPIDALAGAIGERTRGVIVVNPNNPTGSFVTRDEALALDRVCADRGLALIADEVFADFALPDAPPSRHDFAAAGEALTFVLSGLSKSCGLPQLKLAWIAATGPNPPLREASARLEWIGDAFLSVGTPIMLALPRLLADRGAFQARMLDRLHRNHTRLADALAARPEFERLRVEGGWSAVLRVPRTRSEEEWALALLDRGVIVHPGHYYDFADEAYLVISLIAEPAVFDAALQRIVSLD